MKRSWTLASYFRPTIEEPPAPSVPEQETNGSAPLPSQGTEEETLGTRVSGTQIQRNQFDSLGLAQETITSNTSVPATAAQLMQPPVEQRTVGIEASNENVGFEEGSNHVFGPEDIIVDPGLRKPIEEMHPNIRDDVKREYVLLGPCQTIGHTYPKKKINDRNRSFHDKWYKDRPWLEYSISKDAAFCFYCYLFRPLRVDSFGVESFTKNGFVNWKDGPKLFDDPDFTNCVDLGVLAMKMVQIDRHTTFSLVYRLIELALILPVATATVERAFSAMKIIKTELRNRMGDEWLNYRMICYIEREIFASIKNDDILYYFQELKSRLKKLPKQSTTTTCDEEMEDVTVNAPSSH